MFGPNPGFGHSTPPAAEPDTVGPQPSEPHDPDLRELARRTVPRDEIELYSWIRSKELGTINIRVNDISPYGFQARARGTLLERGQVLRLLLPLVGEVEASVMWGLKGMFGCKFDMPIDADTYPGLLATIREDGDRWMERADRGQ